MSIEVKNLPATFGAVVTGVDLARITDSQFGVIRQLWLEHALLVFPEQHLSKKDQIAFAERFGELEFELTPVGNVKKDGSLRAYDESDNVVKILKGNEGWHYDSTYMEVQALGTVFTAHKVPNEGGQTGWADMRAAYAALDDEMKTRVSELSAYHSLYHSQRKVGHDPQAGSGYGFHDQDPPLRPLVKVHPETGVPALLIGRHAYGVPGMSDSASEKLLNGLTESACQAPRVYTHEWQVGDAIVWDNRCLMHRALPWDFSEAREMWQARISGDPATERGLTHDA